MDSKRLWSVKISFVKNLIYHFLFYFLQLEHSNNKQHILDVPIGLSLNLNLNLLLLMSKRNSKVHKNAHVVVMHRLFFQKSHCFVNKSHWTIEYALKLFSINVVEVITPKTIAKPQLSISNGLFVGYITFLPTSFKFFMLPIVNDKKRTLKSYKQKNEWQEQ